MKTLENTRQNIKIAFLPPVDPEQFWDFLRPPPDEIAKIDAEMHKK